ncbi:MAG: undecaprenyl/decaprenyl-phosphate alpha-N-acetylglucosaminyl 1-phosphate transferase [Pelagibacteraceae bacterium]|jgi:UDP-GlcNAc:undecaprenyl-phosphate/decaprenyl-phosphate GlcNAc-1-phosphate transferase|nr:undecaprenyl/decaprenyl-phosphate alpha-N-acetylglucosaminyl 1-phosphate transferase [Pelagibacteraceae bacterium]MBT5213535.1 undecaprenyl/decaprenyl-phosphate alpha-N-acetylglucosaminyl 1-phosphate transferase [Pelagibacteraceae bacterium]
MILPVIISSFFLSILTLSFSQKLFLRKKIFDEINLRSSHNSIATRSGGLSIYIVLIIISIYFYINSIEIFNFSILVPLSILFFVGIYDDFYKVDFKLKFIFQIIVAKIIIDNGFIIDNFHGFIGVYEINRVLAQLVTLFIIVSIINAINLIDGIDGLLSSITLLFIIAYEFFASVNTDFYFLSLIIITSLIPLYYFNFRKTKKIFLGDSGSYLLGGIIAVYVLNILSVGYRIRPEFDINKIILLVSILIYPIIDVIRVFTLRLMNKKSPFIADKNHIHHNLLKYNKSHFKTTFLICCFTIVTVVFIQLIF